MEKEYITKVQEWLRWWNWHRSQIPSKSLETQVEFLLKANYGAVELLAGLVDQLLLEEQGEKARSHLIVPVWTR